MDPLIQIADAVVADLDTVKAALGVEFTVERNYAPTWDPAEHTPAENRQARVYVAPVADEGEDDSRSNYTHRSTIQIVVGAFASESRDHRDQLITLGGEIAKRYRTHANRALTYDTDKQALVLAVSRPAVYDVDTLRADGALLGAINLTVRFDEET